MSKINKSNILAFIEGNIKLLGDRINLLPEHIKEQVYWRSILCKDDCMIVGSCKYCGCKVPGKLYVKKSCNKGEIFPDLMEKEQWEAYKNENKIEIKNG